MPTLVDAIYKPLFSTKQKRPLFLVPVPAGFPSPADDYLEGALDHNEPSRIVESENLAPEEIWSDH